MHQKNISMDHYPVTYRCIYISSVGFSKRIGQSAAVHEEPIFGREDDEELCKVGDDTSSVILKRRLYKKGGKPEKRKS